MSTKTPEQRAQERYQKHGWLTGRPMWFNEDDPKRAEGYATCYREEVEPRERLLQELVDALANVSKESENIGTIVCNCGAPATGIQLAANYALAKAKEQFGITPTP